MIADGPVLVCWWSADVLPKMFVPHSGHHVAMVGQCRSVSHYSEPTDHSLGTQGINPGG